MNIIENFGGIFVKAQRIWKIALKSHWISLRMWRLKEKREVYAMKLVGRNVNMF